MLKKDMLTDTLHQLKELSSSNPSFFKNELSVLEEFIYELSCERNELQYSIILQNIIYDTDRLISKIEKDIAKTIPLIETEMHGMQVYSDYEKRKINNCAYKQKLKETLVKINKLMQKSQSQLHVKNKKLIREPS